MKISKIFIIPLILAVIILQGDAQLPIVNPNPIEYQVPPTLSFYRTDGISRYDPTLLELSDTREDPLWGTFFRDVSSATIIACVTGIWRFFPSTNYHVITPENTGYIFGESDKSNCYVIGTNGALFLDILSYRALGGDDINCDAIHFYSENYGGGNQTSFYAPFSQFPSEIIPNIPNQVFTTRSFLITGKQPALPDPENTPVYKIILDPLGDARIGSICFVLNKEIIPGKVGRMHLQDRMTYVDDADEVVKPLFLGSLQHFTLNNVTEEDCPVRSTVGQSLDISGSVATFPTV